jgi:hypothetical protein
MFASISPGCCICFHTYEVFSGVFFKCFAHMFQVFQLFHTYVASVLSGCFKNRSCVAASVSDACFICLQMYVASVASGCFKSRSGVASLSLLFYCLTFTSVSPPSTSWASAAPSPLLDAGIATCCSYWPRACAWEAEGARAGIPYVQSVGPGRAGPA